jgi:hypothetical protein
MGSEHLPHYASHERNAGKAEEHGGKDTANRAKRKYQMLQEHVNF